MVDWNPEWEPPNLHRQQDRLASFPCIQENTSGALGDSAEIHGTESTFTSLRSSGLQFAPNSSPVFNFSELSRWNGTPPPAIPQTTPNITFSEHCPYPEPGFDIQESYERRESPKHFSTVSHDVLPTFMPFYDNSLPSPSFSPPNVESLGNTSESPSIWYGDVSGLNIPDDPFSAPSQSPTAAPSGAQMPYALDSHFISAVPPFHAREMHPRDDTQTSSFSKLSYDNSDGDYFSNIGLPEGTLRSQHPRARDSDALPISAPITGSVSPIAAPSSEHSCGGPFDVAATSIQGYLYPSSSTSALSFHSDENNQDHDGRPLTWDDGIITPTRNMLDFTLIVHHSTNHEESPLVLEQTEEYEGYPSHWQSPRPVYHDTPSRYRSMTRSSVSKIFGLGSSKPKRKQRTIAHLQVSSAPETTRRIKPRKRRGKKEASPAPYKVHFAELFTVEEPRIPKAITWMSSDSLELEAPGCHYGVPSPFTKRPVVTDSEAVSIHQGSSEASVKFRPLAPRL